MKVATEYFSYKQAMNYMGFTAPKTLTEYIKQGLPTIKVGKSKRIAKSDIDKFMAAHRVVATQDEGGENHD
ncbi:DNA-binding protein [Lactobacillus sp. UMNPBX5]|nr:DNA-binding protein [Lactobacillus sp. UMNPBX5]